jgi:hypothetical protein
MHAARMAVRATPGVRALATATTTASPCSWFQGGCAAWKAIMAETRAAPTATAAATTATATTVTTANVDVWVFGCTRWALPPHALIARA